ncbi:MAG: 16S rRNA (adenine(1518)-N(6)/adenine(1519)-N(6))-dimethyltransferase RsmA [Nitrospira sp.]|nr:16S rRNA (adenine(1518)-N(6)/adenine(1519)-N(6))-dimethyltransferase RsmA [Nitrospira sp.]MDH4369308.1 16S rRNA (adenine(1518)-N(6)/adenine(1519)-N(6))-dimethyltransferase RsmA [Nitrospira sp.]MDH5346514.1 16S rRNA (adenine(1518)-N(6)/adenine(1519)-N(6))-dimethyltransferase RsmA [Nitrospira sp.]MDH5497704.1 16S rRNA (adenine(1518)-N(6)/adenine(1519)-N(6))-dimethyltransferase RsmA [Nitrospira sp.]MDH5725561.1 16S rRNA (adenine(1518)-N(6)/adenine(1519)-N(6))-dimethyltransferase RsmA [Nitrospir
MGDSPLPAAIKRLGQNFLIDPNIVRKIVTLAELSRNDSVLEIGPGRGILTDALCQSAGRVTAIEIDPRLHAYLTERHTQFPNLTLVLGDAMTYPIEQLPPGTIAISNLPYYLSTPLLFRLLEQQQRITRLVLMLQNEVADRLVAQSGSSDYGVLSVMAQYSADITKAFKVSPQCFRPRPNVDSAVVLLRTKSRIEQMRERRDQFATLVRAAFAHRRKTLVNSLRDQGYDQHQVIAALTALHLSLSVRAENLSLDEFIALTHQIHGLSHSSRLQQLDQLS